MLCVICRASGQGAAWGLMSFKNNQEFFSNKERQHLSQTIFPRPSKTF